MALTSTTLGWDHVRFQMNPHFPLCSLGVLHWFAWLYTSRQLLWDATTTILLLFIRIYEQHNWQTWLRYFSVDGFPDSDKIASNIWCIEAVVVGVTWIIITSPLPKNLKSYTRTRTYCVYTIHQPANAMMILITSSAIITVLALLLTSWLCMLELLKECCVRAWVNEGGWNRKKVKKKPSSMVSCSMRCVQNTKQWMNDYYYF